MSSKLSLEQVLTKSSFDDIVGKKEDVVVAYLLRQVEDLGENFLEVLKHREIVFRMRIKNDLVFATTSLDFLWVLESTPEDRMDVSTEVDLTTGEAISYTLKQGKRTRKTAWAYHKADDSWELFS